MRPSSLWGGRIMRRTLSVRLSVRRSVPLSLPSVTSRHLANYNDTHVLSGTRWGPHIVRPSWLHRFLLYFLFIFNCIIFTWNANWCWHTRRAGMSASAIAELLV